MRGKVSFVVLGLLLGCGVTLGQGTGLAETQKTRKVTLNPRDRAELVMIPGGDNLSLGDWDQNPNHPHTVKLSDYSLYKYPVTVKQFRAYCKATGVLFDWKGLKPRWGWHDDHPMVNVTWSEARAYCLWAGGDLPTEAQWEHAARGAQGLKYPWGDTFDGSKLWYGKRKGTASVYRKENRFENAYGCVDMAGNVWQWCLDTYEENFWNSAASRVKDPRNTKEIAYKSTDAVLRGGSWGYLNPDYFRSSYRCNYARVYRYDSYGFRCVIDKSNKPLTTSPL